MVREEAINVMQKYTDTDSGISKVVAEAHEMAISALEQEPCIDLDKHDEELIKETVANIWGKEPSRRKGHWIAVYQGDEIINYRCSECELGDINGSTDLYGWDYCRRCGADMRDAE